MGNLGRHVLTRVLRQPGGTVMLTGGLRMDWCVRVSEAQDMGNQGSIILLRGRYGKD